MNSRGKAVALAKLIVSVIGLGLAFWYFAPANWSQLLGSLNLWFAASAVLLLLLAQAANGYRHWAILGGLGRNLPPGTVIALSCAGLFFNQVLPSGLGGDVIRVLNLRRRCGWSRAAASVLLDRFVGVSFYLVIVVILLPFYFHLSIPDAAKAGIVLLSVGPLLGLAVGLWASRWRGTPRRILRRVPVIALSLILLRRVFRPMVLLRMALPVSIAFFLSILAFELVGKGLGSSTSTVGYLMMVPLVFIVAQAPISFGGWGVREGAAVALMPLVGTEPGMAFLISVIFGIAVLLSSLPGLLIWWAFGFDRPAAQAPGLAASNIC
ncbi:MAG TPA: lysylphosphatidylglycerol synthase transmembrane domain-containing protein [Ancylobacter sp.]